MCNRWKKHTRVLQVVIDNLKPKIYNPNFKNGDWVSRLKYLTIKISDSQSGIKSYKAYIDDEWVLMEYDLKNKKLDNKTIYKTWDT